MDAAGVGDTAAQHDSERPSKKTRTRAGCYNCRRRRRKCSERRPTCSACQQRGEFCEWGVKLTFREDNASSLDAEHPSMVNGSRKRPRNFKILDVTPEIMKDYTPFGTMSTDNSGSPNERENVEPVRHSTWPTSENISTIGGMTGVSRRYHEKVSHPSEQRIWHSDSPSLFTPDSILSNQSDQRSFPATDRSDFNLSPGSNQSYTQNEGNLDSDYMSPAGVTPRSVPELLRDSDITSARSPLQTEDAAAELLALRYMPSHLSKVQGISNLGGNDYGGMSPPDHRTHDDVDHLSIDPEIFNDMDGIFLPGSTYQELHSTLRDHLIFTARSNAPTRHGTPEPHPNMGVFSRILAKENPAGRVDAREIQEKDNSPRVPDITLQREYVLWKTWIDEVAPWLDKFDNERHFEHQIPVMAKTSSHLKNAVLALCARQIERKENSNSSSESLSLYQESIHLLLPELHSKSSAVIASCVVLCVLEMMSCAPKEWRRHLEGCANLLEAVGINGFSGGIEQALFWCFARMDVCGALISQDLTLIPVHRWASNMGQMEDLRLFQNPNNSFDTYANFAVYLCANCVAYVENYHNMISSDESTKANFTSRWIELVNLLEDWYDRRPEEMKPILTIPASNGSEDSPFPIVLYGNASAVSGNQLYHTAILLLLQEKPNGTRPPRKQKSIFWHARQICAISQSNTHHGAWTNSIQPIWIAGKVMSHPTEHKTILDILERIQRETGWETRWRREDLKAWWGDSDE